MKKSLLILVLLLTFKVIAQQDNIQKTSNSEIKVNGFNLIVFKAADLSYEYLLNENQSVGIGMWFRLQPIEVRELGYLETEVDYSRIFSVTPYYRRYFSKKYAKGFFVEGFAMYNTGKEFEFTINDTGGIIKETIIEQKYKHYNLGLSLGVKMVS